MTAVPHWILATTLVDPEPLVIAVGRASRPLKSIDDVVRGPRRKAIRKAIAMAHETQHAVDTLYAREGYRVVAEPFLSPIGRVNAVRVCTVPYRVGDDCADELPERLPVGAWVWDLNRSVTLPSPELYDMYRVPEELRKPEVSAVEWLSGFARQVRTPGTVLAATVVGSDGETLHDQWPTFRHDGVLREMRVAMRIEQDGPQRWLHGVTCDVTEGEAADEPVSSFAEVVIDADLASQEGVVTAVFDLRDLRPVRWLSDPPASVQWRHTGDPDRDPGVHPEDMAELRRLGREVLAGPVQGQLRVRGVDGSWVTVHCSAVLMTRLYEQGVRAAMVKIREVPDRGGSDRQR